MNISSAESASTRHQPVTESRVFRDETDWRSLYLMGSAGAVLAVLCIALAVVVFIAWPIPTTVEAWFARYHQNGFIGLLDLDLLLVTSYVAMIPLYLALYVALRRVSPSLMALALACDLLGAALMVTVNPAFAMLSLSDQYAAATTEVQRVQLRAAGQALLTNWQGTAFDVAYFLGAVAALLIAAVMLRSTIFSRTTAYAGLAMGALALVPATAGTVGIVVSLVSLVPTVFWLILVGLRLFEVGRVAPAGQSRRV